MVEECIECDCIPYENECCCPSEAGITITQPACQTLPDGSITVNPCFDGHFSFWTYKFQTNCDMDTRGISSIGIPICENIHTNIITVEEEINGCGSFREVSFERIRNDPNFGEAPEGFLWLKIESDDRFDQGVCVKYRIKIRGNFPASEQPIAVKAHDIILDFFCEGCYLVPDCPAEPSILVNKECEKIIENNEATLKYTVDVTNNGNILLPNVDFVDQITYDATIITIGNIEIDPPLDIDLTTPGIINISGNLGNIAPGDLIRITIEIPITNIAAPGQYNIKGTATATSPAMGAQSTMSCLLVLDAVRLRGEKCCLIGETPDVFQFRVQVDSIGDSPQTRFDIIDILVVHPGVTVRFTSFDDCSAVFADNQQPVPLNTNVTDRTIIIRCLNETIPKNGTITKHITGRVISTTAFVEPVGIRNSLNQIRFLEGEEQILLGIDNVPVDASFEVGGFLECQKDC